MSTVPTLKDKISEIINQCKDTPAEAPYQKTCKLEYELIIQVLKICGDPLEGAKVTINPFAITDEEEKATTKANGKVDFKKLKRKHYIINVEYEGFTKKVETIVLPQRKLLPIQFGLADIKDDEFKITLIPRIMRHNKWDKGAELMEHWFKQKEHKFPEGKDTKFYNNGKHPYNDTIITLDWVKKFELTKDSYEEIWNKKRYMSKAVQNQLKEKHIKDGTFNKVNKIGSTYNIIKSFSKDVNVLNSTDYVQTISPVNKKEQIKYGVYRSHDDLMAALANFNFRCALEYSVEFTRIENSYRTIEHYFKADEKVLKGKKKIYTYSVTKVALYIRDAYDFNGINAFGGLGSWNYKEKDLDAFNWVSIVDDYVSVTNKTFRDWRDKNNCGGDFLVFSDIETRDVNDTWEVEVDI
jgi:hypothetical protein